MGIFGKSAKELDDFAKKLQEQELDLNNRELQLKNRESDVKLREGNVNHERTLLETAKSSFVKERTEHLEEVKRFSDQIALERADLEKNRQEVIRQEAEAKAGFAKTQEETFKKVIEKRVSELDARQADLEKFAQRIAADLAGVTVKEGEIAQRELRVTEREQRADAGFADKVTALAAETKRQQEANLQKANQLEERENLLAEENARLEAVKELVRQREQKAADAERQRDAGYADERASFDSEINDKRAKFQKEAAQKLNDLQIELAKQKTGLLARLEAEIADIREKRLAEITDAEEKERVRIRKIAEEETVRIRKTTEEEAAHIRKTLEDEVARVRKTTEEEAARVRSDVDLERKTWNSERATQQAELKRQSEANEEKAGKLSAKDDYQIGKEQELQAKERDLESLRNQLEEIVEERIAERKATFDSQTAEHLEENQRLRDSLRIQTGLVGAFEQLKRQLGDTDPAEILRDLNSKTDELKRLREELATRPTEEMRERYEILEKETEDQKERIKNLEEEKMQNADAVAEAMDLSRKNSELASDNKFLTQRAERGEASAEEANTELKRLRSAYERPAEVAARYKEIEMPYITADNASHPADLTDDSTPCKLKKVQKDCRNAKQDEMMELKEEERRLTLLSAQEELRWLDGIGKACDNYGLHFPQRILKAFHTALKTAEWSPITILAGVSGTGKSELPRLYSHFGGLLFEPLSVQPNWDSQESMLGFFNSIDNKFDAQPVLRFLTQSQQTPDEPYEKRLERWRKMAGTTLNLDSSKQDQEELIRTLKESNYPGLQDCVCMVLLDEMNLAHPELYFAEFLSKLELRRGMKRGDVPYLPVKIGAGLPPYQLPLGRNVFWTGTMNQDETTKSLSDKVLDRSIVIYFPRPAELKRRKELKPLDDKNRGKLLHKSAFFSWFAQESQFTDEQVKPYKKFIEEINQSLGVAGRAIGHRVWQSIEYYMANYPDVRAAVSADGDESSLQIAMNTAFEDQLVQKVMPKLRGIDTRGKSKTDCLDKILGQLNTGIHGQPFSLNEDFTLACELGYGQFIWQSANYLNEENDSNTQVSL